MMFMQGTTGHCLTLARRVSSHFNVDKFLLADIWWTQGVGSWYKLQGPADIAHVLVFLGSIIICRLHRLTLFGPSNSATESQPSRFNVNILADPLPCCGGGGGGKLFFFFYPCPNPLWAALNEGLSVRINAVFVGSSWGSTTGRPVGVLINGYGNDDVFFIFVLGFDLYGTSPNDKVGPKISVRTSHRTRVRGGAVGRGTALQTRRLRVLFRWTHWNFSST